MNPSKKSKKSREKTMLRTFSSDCSHFSQRPCSPNLVHDDEEPSRPRASISSKKSRPRSPMLNTPPTITLHDDEDFVSQQFLQNAPRLSKPYSSDLNTPILSETQMADIQKPIQKPNKTRSYFTFHRDDYMKNEKVSELQASADSYLIWSSEKPGCSGEGCVWCEEAQTLCDVCVFFLPRLTRIHLFRMYCRYELQHLLDKDGKCVLCKQEGPQNQLCPDNIWTQSGELIAQHEKLTVLKDAVETRWSAMLERGIVTPAERGQIIERGLYGKFPLQASVAENAEIRRRTENTKQTKINEMLEADHISLKKSMVSSTRSERVELPPRTVHSAEIEQWILRAELRVELDAGETRVIRTMTDFCHDKSLVSHVCRIEKLQNHWLGDSVDAMLSIKSGVMSHDHQGCVKVSIYNRSNRPTVIRKGAVLGLFVRENYLFNEK